MIGRTTAWQVGDCHEVVPLLEQVIARSRDQNDTVGYFAMLYRLTTQKIVHAANLASIHCWQLPLASKAPSARRANMRAIKRLS